MTAGFFFLEGGALTYWISMLPPIIMRNIAGILLTLLASVNCQGNVLHGQRVYE